MKQSKDYSEQVYAGILGKIIGVYLGRPFEGWQYQRILKELGEIQYYVNDSLGVPLVVTDDDIAGTFVFLRALEDNGLDRPLTSRIIGQTWLNYLIEHQTILWWGGVGNSTEHTTYKNLTCGIEAPESGCVQTNGVVLSEQIGAQIFVDGWAMICPGDPQQAAHYAGLAGRVSHDGESVYASQLLAAMEAAAFVESDIDQLINIGLSVIPSTSLIYKVVNDIRNWVEKDCDWHRTRQRIESQYGYDKFGGYCHVVPNHSLIHLALMYGAGDFQKSLSIVNTSGWDTDCNSGNLGCLLGIRNGLSAFNQKDWRSMVADRMFLSSADGGSTITDAVTQAVNITNLGRSLKGQPLLNPKNGARYHFSFPGSLQGFRIEPNSFSQNLGDLCNPSVSTEFGKGHLALHYKVSDSQPLAILTDTFIPPDAVTMPPPYQLIACPNLYPGQIVSASIHLKATSSPPIYVCLTARAYGEADCIEVVSGPEVSLTPGESRQIEWKIVGLLDGKPIAQVGLSIRSDYPAEGILELDWLTWDGDPSVCLARPENAGDMWKRAWVNTLDQWSVDLPEAYNLVKNSGRGLLIQGSRMWKDYEVSTILTPHSYGGSGLVARFQGLRRYYAIILKGENQVFLVKVSGESEQVLASAVFEWSLWHPVVLSLSAQGNRITAMVDGSVVLSAVDALDPYLDGAIALLCQDGSVTTEQVRIEGLN
jgi:ADP-ribosylglycohydrolase